MNASTFINDAMPGDHWSGALAYAPEYGLLLVALPLLSLLAIKLWLMTRTTAQNRAPKEWVLSRDLDDDGIPLLEKDSRNSSQARMRQAYNLGSPTSRPRF